MSTSEIQVDRDALLAFYDTITKDNRGHATAINAVAGEDLGAGLIKHYLENREGATVSILREPVTPGTKRGERLDRWIHVKRSNGETLYQVEIKNWSAHAIGGRVWPPETTEEEVQQFRTGGWAKYWDATNLTLLVGNRIDKVLKPMRRPAAYPDTPIAPLLCMWEALHPQGLDTPFFTEKISGCAHFHELSVFSMSMYLRSLHEPTLILEMPATCARLKWLNILFSVSDLGDLGEADTPRRVPL